MSRRRSMSFGTANRLVLRSLRSPRSPRSFPPMLDRLARTCFRRRGRTVLIWIAVLIGVNVIANGIVGADYRADMNLPDSESKQVQDQLEAASPNRAGFNAQIVFEASQGVEDPQVRTAMEGLFEQ